MTETPTCPKCGTVMNHQADKLTHPVSVDEVAMVTPLFEGIVVSIFACPRCGWIESQRAVPPISV